MASKRFVFQGLTSRTHRAAVREVLRCPAPARAILSVAFVTSSGVELLDPELRQCPNLTVFAGIRNELTSRQGLELLLTNGAKLYAVDTGARTPLYHPKLYYVRGATESRLLVGSANLTIGGMNNNIEASVAIYLDLNDAGDTAFGLSVESEFDALVTHHAANVAHITSAAQLQRLQDRGLLIDESSVPPPRPARATTSVTADAVPRMELKVTPIFKVVKKAKKAAKPAATSKVSGTAVEWKSVWQSKALTERDLNIPKGKNTHVTGSMNLDKGLLGETIDHRHYFREEVFSALDWTPTNKSGAVVEATANFQLVVKGIEHGAFDLRLGHTTSTTSRSYKQKNAMTRLSWGAMRPHVAQDPLLGRTLTLYRDEVTPTRFMIEID